MVVSVIPCVLSARAAVDPRAESSRASPSARSFMGTSAKGWWILVDGRRSLGRPCCFVKEQAWPASRIGATFSSPPALGRRDVLAQGGQTLVPAAAEIGHPRHGAGQGLGRDAIELLPTAARGCDQPCLGEHAQVLGHGLPRHRQGGGKPGRGGRALLGQGTNDL